MNLSEIVVRGLFLVEDGLERDAEPALDDAFVADDGHLVNERHVVEEIAQVDEGAADESEPWEAVVEWVASDHVLHVVWLGGSRRGVRTIVVHIAHKLQSVPSKRQKF